MVQHLKENLNNDEDSKIKSDWKKHFTEWIIFERQVKST